MDRELRRQARMAMRGVPERLGLSFAGGNVEMRAKPDGTAAGTSFEWRGYATVYDADFPMYDPHGEPYTESVAQGACRRSLANPALDVPFLVGHNDAGIPMARTKSGTMRLSEDSRGLLVHVPAMDGRREDVRALASAVERGDMSEMSLAFVCNRQEWDEAFEHRTIVEMDLHRGDVCAVVHGANPATAGAWMAPVEQLSVRRPAAIGGPVLLERRASAAQLAEQHGHPGRPCVDPDGDGDCDLTPEGDTDHDYWTADGRQIKPLPGADGDEGRASVRLLEVLSSVTQAERDKAKAAGNSLPDGSYPINTVAQLHSAAVLAASHHGDWKAAQALIRRRAKELGVDVTTLPGFAEEKSSGLPLEHRASAAEDVDVSTASDYNAAYDHAPMTGTHTHAVPHTHDGSGHSANIMVDDATGIPGDEQQFAADNARREQLRQQLVRLFELEELAS